MWWKEILLPGGGDDFLEFVLKEARRLAVDEHSRRVEVEEQGTKRVYGEHLRATYSGNDVGNVPSQGAIGYPS